MEKQAKKIMNDKDIIKALEYCAKRDCADCDLQEGENDCLDVLYGRTINLIKCQQAELELLREFVSKITEKMNDR